MILGQSIEGHSVRIDLERLVEGRLMMQANSGAGKSWALRRLLEQTAGKIQHIVLDVEDEFHTLREKHDYILAGRDGGDCPADRRSAELLGRRLLELGMSAVISIYEMKPDEREEFVRLFLESLISAPRSLWHPALIIIDEAHMFCPEGGKSETTGAVVDLMARGRKRGYAGVLATQRISKINKDAIAEVNNKLIGRAALDIDMKRAADELGFSAKEKQLYLRTLPAGRFFAFGPALSGTVLEMTVGEVFTTHPKAGQRSAPATPPPDKVRAVLEQLANLPHEAEEEAKTADELRAKVKQLEGELRKAQRPGIDPEELKKHVHSAEIRGRELASKEYSRRLHEIVDEKLEIERELVHVNARVNKIGELAKAMAEVAFPPPPPSLASDRTPVNKSVPIVHKNVAQASGPGEKLPPGEKAILTAVAQFGEVRRQQLTTLTGYTRSSRNTYLQRLSQRDFIEIDGERITITQAGVNALGSGFEPLPTGPDLQDYWLQRLPPGEAAILKVLIQAYPRPVGSERLSEATAYTRSSRNTYLQRLTAKELVVRERNGIRANANLFE